MSSESDLPGNSAEARKRGNGDSLRVLVVAAVEAELHHLRDRLASVSLPANVVLALTGVGKAAAAMAVTEAHREVAPGLIVNTGCAGALPASGLRIGDVVWASEEVFADDGVETSGGFLTLGELGLATGERRGSTVFNVVPTHGPSGALLARARAALPEQTQLVVGRLATVSTGSGNDARAAIIANRWHPVAENMEGAATALVAWCHSCPFVEIRGISNHAGQRDRGAWDIGRACDNAARVIVEVLAGLSETSSMADLLSRLNPLDPQTGKTT